MPIVYRPPTQTFNPLLCDPDRSPIEWDLVSERYADMWDIENKPKSFTSFGELVSRRICSRFNKNAILSLFGETGSGKSMAALSLAYNVAEWNAKFLGGKPEDYFTLDNVAIIHPEMLRNLIKGMKRHNVYILDDAGAAYDARNYMKNDNKALGYVLQTFRTLNGFLIVTGVDGAMLDVNLHRTARYYAEVSNSRHDLGFSDVSVFRVKRRFRQKQTHYRFLSQSNTKIRAYRADLPPKELVEPYETVRREQVDWVLAMDAGDQKGGDSPEQKKREEVYLSCHVCGHGWTYTGRSKSRATCPSCNTKVPINGLSTTTP